MIRNVKTLLVTAAMLIPATGMSQDIQQVVAKKNADCTPAKVRKIGKVNMKNCGECAQGCDANGRAGRGGKNAACPPGAYCNPGAAGAAGIGGPNGPCYVDGKGNFYNANGKCLGHSSTYANGAYANCRYARRGQLAQNCRNGEGFIGSMVYCCNSKAFPDAGWAPPLNYPLQRTGYGFGGWYGNQGPFVGGAPMVYQATDTTQLGYSYANVPQWQPEPHRLPPVPIPSHYHRRGCLNTQANCNYCNVHGHIIHQPAAPQQQPPVVHPPQPSVVTPPAVTSGSTPRVQQVSQKKKSGLFSFLRR